MTTDYGRAQAPERLKKARINLLMDEPFFGSLMMQLKPVETKDVPTFSTDGRTLKYNPDYMATLNDRQLRTVLAHEVMHPALLHPYRMGKRDLKRANEAADYAINNFLDNYNKQSQARGEAAPFEWPTKEDGQPDIRLDHSYDDMSFEDIYERLNRKKQQQQGQGQGQGQGQQDQGAGQPQPDQGEGEGQGQGQGQGQGAGTSRPQQPPSPGEFTAGATDEAETQAQEAKWKVALKQAAMIAKGQGRLPGEMERLITELLDPKASWKEILRTLLTSAAKDDYTWTRPNPRYSGRGIIMPSLHVPRMASVVCAIDTSGSIDQDQINEFMAEVRAILFDCRPEKLIVVPIDATIHDWIECDPMDDVDVAVSNRIRGGGGTDFRPLFERVEQELSTEPPAALVYLTDLYGDFPDQPPYGYPVIWAANNDKQAPWGDTICIK